MGNQQPIKSSSKQNGLLNENKFYRIMIEGDIDVGKSSFSIQFAKNQFIEIHDLIEDTYRKQIELDEKQLIIEIIDSNFENYRNENRIKSDGFIYVIDINTKKTIDGIHSFIEEIQRIKEKQNFPLVLFFNKSDLEIGNHEIKQEEIEELMKVLKSKVSENIKYFIGSVKAKNNVNDSIYELVHQIDQEIMEKK